MFQVEELEERVEFGKWSAEVEGGATYDPSTGGGSGGGNVTLTKTITL